MILWSICLRLHSQNKTFKGLKHVRFGHIGRPVPSQNKTFKGLKLVSEAWELKEETSQNKTFKGLKHLFSISFMLITSQSK